MNKNETIRTIIGFEYLNRKGYLLDHTDQLVRRAFEVINQVNEELFAKIPYEVIFTSEDPYTSAKHMREEVQRTNKIYILESDTKTGYSGHPLLTDHQNNIGRAVHDVWAHCVCGCPFTFEGEYTAYLEQRQYYPEWTWRVLFAEIPAQTAAYYVNGGHDFQQRAIAAPQNWMELGDQLELKDYSKNSILPSLLWEVKNNVAGL